MPPTEPTVPGATPDLRLQPGPHVFVDDLDRLELDDDDRHHLARSLRLRAGEPLTASDGRGRWRAARFGDQVEPTGEIHEVAAPPYEIGLGLALTKATKPEFAVQKATEIGIGKLMVFEATHSVVRWDEAKRARSLTRLRRVAREAAMQSRQVRVPAVTFVSDLARFVAEQPVARADFGGIAANLDHRFVLIGPEGGWAAAEIDLVPDAVDLGRTVLRAETAAIVASTILVRTRDYQA